jgi:hypothetical protein
MQTKKGFILIYTVLVGLICLIIMMYIFDMQMTEAEYSKSNKAYILKEDNYQRYKEYLMTLFFTYIDENDDGIKTLGIDEFFYNTKGSIVAYEKAKVSYANETQIFTFKTPYTYNTYRNDYFKLIDIDENFQLIFIKTDYSNK